MTRVLVSLVCDWCTARGEYDTPEEAVEAGWFRLETEEDSFDFCAKDCLISWL